jgi:hypothetical protein
MTFCKGGTIFEPEAKSSVKKEEAKQICELLFSYQFERKRRQMNWQNSYRQRVFQSKI